MKKILCEKCKNDSFYLEEVEELGTKKGYTEKVKLTRCSKCDEINTRCFIYEV